jgi:hypothetical protein
MSEHMEFDNSQYVDESPEVREMTEIEEITQSFIDRAEFEISTSSNCRQIDRIISRHLERTVFGGIIEE